VTARIAVVNCKRRPNHTDAARRAGAASLNPMKFSSIRDRIRDRFAPKTEIHHTLECQMHVHADARERHIDISICHEVQADDCYHVRELAASEFAPRVIVDIGAHIGSFTALAAKYFPEAKIYSFEPLKQHYDVLVKNARRTRCTPKNLAVLGFYGGEHGHDIYPGNEFERAYRGRQLSNAISVAEMFRNYKLNQIDWLKIDCEQSEVNIFRELNFIDRLKDIDVISGEWHFETAKAELRTIVGKTHDVDIVDEGLWNHFYAKRKSAAA
jgi:FkbM family methyltransferase